MCFEGGAWQEQGHEHLLPLQRCSIRPVGKRTRLESEQFVAEKVCCQIVVGCCWIKGGIVFTGDRSPSGTELLLDIEDYLRTPHYFPDFVEKFLILATNSRQLMEWYRQVAEQTSDAPGTKGPAEVPITRG